MTTNPAYEKLLANLNYPAELPIVERRSELVDAIANNQVLIVAGETGSGKSTQLPKLCIEAGKGRDGLIGHTQPRRLAARSIADRIAQETNTTVGDEIGFAVRFNDRVGPNSRIKLMTDGILLAELQHDRKLSRYDTLIIDEAHERSLNIDFILGYLRQLLPRRPDLTVIITSATIDTERFANHFATEDGTPATIIEVSGRSYPVEHRYQPLVDEYEDRPIPQVDGITRAVTELIREGPGDMLVFLAGERDIREAADAITDLNLHDTEVFPLYARLSAAEQHRVFSPHKGRRIVLATNVAETSVTVPGIRYVIDPGNARISRFNQRTKVQRLPIEAISQASANQRAGRCGRIGPGISIRLYAEDDFETRDEFTDPEIQRTNLASVILQMASLGLGDINRFPFLDPPDPRSINDGIALLEELHALDPEHEFKRRWLTNTGRELAKLPVDPRFGRMILEAADHGGLAEVLIIVAGLSVQDPRERPTEKRQQAAEFHNRYNDERSDFLTLLNLWKYLGKERKARSSNQFRRLCGREFLNYNRVREWQDTHSQLRSALKDLGYKAGATTGSNEAKPDTIHQAILAGLLSHIGMKDLKAEQKAKRAAQSRDSKRKRGNERAARPDYIGARNSRFAIGNGSVLAKKPPNWVMAAELVETNRLWARMAAPIDPRWVERRASHLLTYSYTTPTWEAATGTAQCRESATLYGLPVLANRQIPVGKVNPELGRELFIHHGLVENDWETHHDFVAANTELIADLEELESRSRRRDLLVEQQRLHNFFDAKLPATITSGTHFNKWWKKAKAEQPSLLTLQPEDLLDPGTGAIDPNAYPDSWLLDHLDPPLDLELAYEFDAASPLDGLSVHVPVEVLNQVTPEPFTWSVPGLRLELITELLRTLPKATRKHFTPLTDTAAAVAPILDRTVPTLPQDLADKAGKHAGVVLSADEFDWHRVPAHLRPTFRVINADRELLAEGKDLAALKANLAEQTEQAVAAISSVGETSEQAGLRTWTVGDLPAEITTTISGQPVRAYPSLVDETDSVALRFLATPEAQADAHWDGVRRLLRFHIPSPVRQLDNLLDNATKLALVAHPVHSKAAWYNDAIDSALDAIMLNAASNGPPLTEIGFAELAEQAADQFSDVIETVADQLPVLVTQTAAVNTKLDALIGASFDASVRDAGANFDRLTYPGFLVGVGVERLGDLGRYLEALAYRLDRLPEQPTADVTKAAELVRVEQHHRDLVDTIGLTEELEAVLWQLEELRVATFAQHLRAPGGPKVSPQRIDRALATIARQAGVNSP